MKLIFYTTILSAGLGVSNLASAQNASYSAFEPHQNMSTTAGFHIIVPLGSEASRPEQNRARFGFMLDLSRQKTSRNFVTPEHINTNLLDLGWQFDGRPTMLLGGTDIYTPLFTPLSAPEKRQYGLSGSNSTKNTILIIAGGALAAGAAIALAGGDDKDDHSSHDDDDDH